MLRVQGFQGFRVQMLRVQGFKCCAFKGSRVSEFIQVVHYSLFTIRYSLFTISASVVKNLQGLERFGRS
jgi:hypothetical protein